MTIPLGSRFVKPKRDNEESTFPSLELLTKGCQNSKMSGNNEYGLEFWIDSEGRSYSTRHLFMIAHGWMRKLMRSLGIPMKGMSSSCRKDASVLTGDIDQEKPKHVQ